MSTRTIFILAGISLLLALAFTLPRYWSNISNAPSDFPVYDNSTLIKIPRGEDLTFYAVGKVRLRNYENYCLGVSPKGVFNVTWSDGVNVVYIEAKSGKRELATVTSKPLEECDVSEEAGPCEEYTVVLPPNEPVTVERDPSCSKRLAFKWTFKKNAHIHVQGEGSLGPYEYERLPNVPSDFEYEGTTTSVTFTNLGDGPTEALLSYK